MQMDDDLPVHLNVFNSMFKQWWHVKKYKNILMVISLDVMDVHKIQLMTQAICESLGDSIQRGRGRGGRGYLDK